MARRDVTLFDRLAPLYDRAMPTANHRALRAGLAMADGDVERALDVGGGTGRAARMLPALSFTVVDAARGMLREGRRHGLDCVQADAARLPIRDGAVDAVVVVDALHHIDDRMGTIEEAHRALREGGVLVVREFDRATFLGRGLALAESAVGFDSEFFTPDELAAAFERSGFDHAVPDRGFSYTVVGVKR